VSDLSSERAPHMDRTVTFKQEETSGHEPQPGLDTKTDRLIDRQSQCDFDFDWSSDSSFVIRHSGREDTRSPVRYGASLRQSLILSCYNWS
jgi:hypothetical protein